MANHVGSFAVIRQTVATYVSWAKNMPSKLGMPTTDKSEFESSVQLYRRNQCTDSGVEGNGIPVKPSLLGPLLTGNDDVLSAVPRAQIRFNLPNSGTPNNQTCRYLRQPCRAASARD